MSRRLKLIELKDDLLIEVEVPEDQVNQIAGAGEVLQHVDTAQCS